MSFGNLPENLSIPAALETLMLFIISRISFSVACVNSKLLDMLKFLSHSFIDSKLKLFVVYGSVFGRELAKLEKQL